MFSFIHSNDGPKPTVKPFRSNFPVFAVFPAKTEGSSGLSQMMKIKRLGDIAISNSDIENYLGNRVRE